MARVLVTRAAPEAHKTAARLHAMGHEAIASPVLEVEPAPFGDGLGGAQCLLFTSAAAAHALDAHAELKAIPIWAVGEATAQAARAAGFERVRATGGDAAALVAAVRSHVARDAGAIVHVRGEDVSADVAGALREAGFDARDVIVYRAALAANLSAQAQASLAAAPARLDSVLFHSARGAAGFVHLVRAAGLDQASHALAALCLSARVAEGAKALSWREIRVASAPREAALLSLL